LYLLACQDFCSLLCEASDSELREILYPDFIRFLSEQLSPALSPDDICPAVLILRAILTSSNPTHSQMMLGVGVIDLLQPLLDVPDPEVISHALVCMAYASNDFAQLQIDYDFGISGALFERTVKKWPQLMGLCLQLTPYFLGVPVVDDYSIDLLRFLMIHFKPKYPADWVFPVLIDWVKNVRGFPYKLLIRTRFLSNKVGHYVKPGYEVQIEAMEVDGCAMLQCLSIRLLSACIREFQEFRQRFNELTLVDKIVAIVNDPASPGVVVAAGLKFIAMLCGEEKMQRFTEMIDLPRVMNRVLRTGTCQMKANFWRFAAAYIKGASPRAREFLLEPGLLAQAAEQIDQGTEKHMLMVIGFLIAVCDATKEIGGVEIARAFKAQPLIERLRKIQEEHPETELSERAVVLIGMLHSSK
jgi:hypothetical protein